MSVLTPSLLAPRLLALVTVLVPMQIDINPNDTGLPGIAQLRTIVGAGDDHRTHPRRARPDHLRDRVGDRLHVDPDLASRGPGCCRLRRRRALRASVTFVKRSSGASDNPSDPPLRTRVRAPKGRIGYPSASLLFQLVTGLPRPDAKRGIVGLVKYELGSFLVITLTGLLLEIVDVQLCIEHIHASGNTLEGMGVKIGVLVAGLTSLTIASPVSGRS